MVKKDLFKHLCTGMIVGVLSVALLTFHVNPTYGQSPKEPEVASETLMIEHPVAEVTGSDIMETPVTPPGAAPTEETDEPDEHHIPSDLIGTERDHSTDDADEDSKDADATDEDGEHTDGADKDDEHTGDGDKNDEHTGETDNNHKGDGDKENNTEDTGDSATGEDNKTNNDTKNKPPTQIPTTPPKHVTKPDPPASVPPQSTRPNQEPSSNHTTTTATGNMFQIPQPIPSFLPSADFINLENRIVFRIDTAIDGLPPFITMEMVVGALKAQDEADIPASVTIAQIIQEGGFGKHGPGGDVGLGLSYLSFQYNNLFGIKGKGTAGSVSLATFEMTPEGETYYINDYFRVYNTVTESIEDRTELLTTHYSDLTEDVTNANVFAWRIGRRWATDINYSRSLIHHMETYDLYRLDEMTLTDYHTLTDGFAHPVPGSVVTSTFGFRTFDMAFHRGIDLGTGNHNLPVYAAESGTVILSASSPTAGNWVVIHHGDGLVTKYMHNLANFVAVGQKVEKGQQIALTGTTGNSTGNHLHFQVEVNGIAVNPEIFYEF